jgi:hypothetical protein
MCMKVKSNSNVNSTAAFAPGEEEKCRLKKEKRECKERWRKET